MKWTAIPCTTTCDLWETMTCMLVSTHRSYLHECLVVNSKPREQFGNRKDHTKITESIVFTSFSTLTLYMLGKVVVCFCCCCFFFSKKIFSKILSRVPSVSNQFGPRSGLTKCQAWSWSKLFAKGISRQRVKPKQCANPIHYDYFLSLF